jgi:hypothetical protein
MKPSNQPSKRNRKSKFEYEQLEAKNLLSANLPNVGDTVSSSALDYLVSHSSLEYLAQAQQQLEVVATKSDDGDGTVLYQQQWQGVPVFGSYLTVHQDTDGSFDQFQGNGQSDLRSLDSLSPEITVSAAEQVASGHVNGEIESLETTLVWFAEGDIANLAFQVDATLQGSESLTADRSIIVDAETGDLLHEGTPTGTWQLLYDPLTVTGEFERIVINDAVGPAGSQAYAASFDSVVALALGCTGTLIAPDVVLTARHCGTPVGHQILFGDDSNAPDFTATVATVDDPAGPGTLLDGGDLTILTLTADVPSTVATPMRLTDLTTDLEGMLAATVGYGFNGVGSVGHQFSSDGIRWGGENIIDVYGAPASATGANIISTDFDDGTAGSNTIPSGDLNPLVNEATTAPGDSGGPVMVQLGGEWVIAGVLSGGTSSTSVFGDISWWTGVAPFRSQIEAAGGVFGDGTITVDTFDEAVPGSLIYTAQASGRIADPADTVTAELSLEAGQTLSTVIRSTDGLTPTFQLTTPGGQVLSAQTESSGDAVVENLSVSEAGIYSVLISSTGGTTGTFDAEFVLNANLEAESTTGVANDTMTAAQPLTASYDLGGDRDRLAAVGSFSGSEVPVIASDDFETGVLSGSWTTFSSEDFGRVEVSDQFGAAEGQWALFMDTIGVANNLNEAILSVDLSGRTDATLAFSHAEFNDENTALPAVFNNSRNGDGVSVSDDGVTWHTILTDTETAAGEWNRFTVNLGEFAAAKGIELNSNFQIKFQQYDDGEIGADGRGFDGIQILGAEGAQDWYSFGLEAGQSATAAVGLGGRLNNAEVSIYDSSGILVGAGVDDPNLTNSIKFTADTTDTYFAKVSGTGLVDYGLVVTRNAEFDTGSSPESPQVVTNDTVLGHASSVSEVQAEPDSISRFVALDDLFEGVAITNNITGSSVYSVPTSFTAPTGTRVFGVDVNLEADWRENVNEFRADFEIGQFNVSIDIGSDDGANDVGYLRAFDSDGVMIAEAISGSIEPDGFESLTVSSAEGSIAYILAGGVGNDEVALDNLRYEIQKEAGDFYLLSAAAGETLRITAEFPGTDEFAFDNQLVTEAGVNLRMELTDVATGMVVASGTEALSHRVDSAGEFQLKVFALQGEGDFVIKVDHIDGILFEIGDTGLGVAANDFLTGSGFIMYSVQNVHERFAASPPIAGNAEHFVAVQHNGNTWQYDNNRTWVDFTPAEGDRLVAAVNFGGDTIASLQGASGLVEGIVQGYDDSDLAFRVNRWAGLGNSGEFEVTGTYFIDSDKEFNIGATNLGIGVTDAATGTGYLMFSVENVHTRFGGEPVAGNSDHLIAVRYNDGWEFNDNQNWIAFTPVAGDQLLASIDFDNDTITSLQGNSAAVNGIGLGYILGDLTFVSNSWAGTGNTGEFEVTGTFFSVSSDVYGEVGDVGNGVAVTDDATGTGFLMYSAEPAQARFSASPPLVGSARHLIAVRYDAGTSSWQYNDNRAWISFTSLAGDRLIASMDFDADTITSLQGEDSMINGIGLGYSTGDLAFTANRWAGLGNTGEFEVTGTFFEV